MLIPVIVMNAILVFITVLLLVAERYLVTYGTCRIQVKKDQETREISVKGGGTLMSALVDNKVEISSSCGGRGTCGYCKCRVVEGGGEILPTEEIFMSRQEKADHMRLACQVKIKRDITIIIPDFLSIVRQMVINRKFDPNKRWRVTIR
jgi:Na+-transporting NADH:ubiquinone oxidoreductase subunit F